MIFEKKIIIHILWYKYIAINITILNFKKKLKIPFITVYCNYQNLKI